MLINCWWSQTPPRKNAISSIMESTHSFLPNAQHDYTERVVAELCAETPPLGGC